MNPTSIIGRLFGVLSAPGEVFAGIAASRFSVANWLVPAALAGVVGLICQLLLFSQPALVQQILDIQDRAIQAQVDAGKMPAAQANAAREALRGEMVQTIMRVAGGVFALLFAAVGPIWWAFLLWVVGRAVFRAPLEFGRALEVTGLASLISMLGGVVGLFLVMGMGTLTAGTHLGFLVKDLDFTNRLHVGLCTLNLFGIWHLLLISLGLAKLLHRPVTPVLVVMTGLWFGYKAIAVILGMGQFVM